MANNGILRPVVFHEHLRLSSFGFHPDAITPQTVALESEGFICVRERVNNNNNENFQVTVINLADNRVLLKWLVPPSCESVIVNPCEKIIAWRSKDVLHMFNMEVMQTFRSQYLEEGVVFWKWISRGTIGIVTETSVYHWLFRNQSPCKVFERDLRLAGAQIVDYHATSDEMWLALVGTSPNSTDHSVFKVKGTMQLYNQKRGVSQIILGHAASFAELQLDGEQSITKLLTYAVRTASDAWLDVEVLEPAGPDSSFRGKATKLHLYPELVDDLPVAVQVSRKHAITFVVTKRGSIYLFDLQSGAFLYTLFSETILAAKLESSWHGLIVVDKNGQVMSLAIDERTIIPWIRSTLRDDKLALKLATRANLPGAEDLDPRYSRQNPNQERHFPDARETPISEIARLEGNVQELRDQLAKSQLTVQNQEKTIAQLRNDVAASLRTASEDRHYLKKIIATIRTREENSNSRVTELVTANRELRIELAESKERADKLSLIIRTHEEKNGRESMDSQNRTHDAAESLLEIASSARDRCITAPERVEDGASSVENWGEAATTYSAV